MEEQKLTGAMLSADYRERLAAILAANKRTFKGQLESWIDEEMRIISRSGK